MKRGSFRSVVRMVSADCSRKAIEHAAAFLISFIQVEAAEKFPLPPRSVKNGHGSAAVPAGAGEGRRTTLFSLASTVSFPPEHS